MATRFTCENISVDNLTSITGTLDITTTNIDENLTGNYTLDCQNFSLDSTQASNVTVTGASQDLTISSTGGSLNLVATEAVADAINVDSSGGMTFDFGAGNNAVFSSGGQANLTINQLLLGGITIDNGGITITNGGVSFTATSGGIRPTPVDGTVVANAVTVNGISGKITDSGVVAAGDRVPIIVTNSNVSASSTVLVEPLGLIGNGPRIICNVSPGAGFFTLYVRNIDAALATDVAPIYAYFVILG